MHFSLFSVSYCISLQIEFMFQYFTVYEIFLYLQCTHCIVSVVLCLSLLLTHLIHFTIVAPFIFPVQFHLYVCFTNSFP